MPRADWPPLSDGEDVPLLRFAPATLVIAEVAGDPTLWKSMRRTDFEAEVDAFALSVPDADGVDCALFAAAAT